jgi:hypothetical protein
VPTEYLSFTFGKRLANGKRWSYDNEHLFSEFEQVIKEEAVPFLNQADTSKQFAERMERIAEDARDPYVLQAKAYSLAQAGDASGAAVELRKLLAVLRSMDGTAPWTDDMMDRAAIFLKVIEEDRESVKRLLCDWESKSRGHLLK